MGRRNGSRVLVPSLFAIATTALACGGTSIGDPNGQGPGGSVAGDGSIAPSPPYLSPTGGYSNDGAAAGPPEVTGGATGIAGGSSLPYFSSCPSDMPAENSPCVPTAGPNALCTYMGECTPVYANCGSNGRWSLSAATVACVGGAAGFDDGPLPSPPPPSQTLPSGPLSCPAATPKPGTPCYLPPTLASYSCDYPSPYNACTVDKATCASDELWSVAGEYIDCAGTSGI